MCVRQLEGRVVERGGYNLFAGGGSVIGSVAAELDEYRQTCG